MKRMQLYRQIDSAEDTDWSDLSLICFATHTARKKEEGMDSGCLIKVPIKARIERVAEYP